MYTQRSLFRTLFSALLILATIAGLINVFSDNADVVRLAEATACGSAGCSVEMTRMARNPIFQSFTFQTKPLRQGKAPASATVDVECKRALYLIGAYECHREL